MAVFADYAKAFPCAMHSILIDVLSGMSAPGGLLRVRKGYLTQRNFCVRFKGEGSEAKELNAGIGEGCELAIY